MGGTCFVLRGVSTVPPMRTGHSGDRRGVLLTPKGWLWRIGGRAAWCQTIEVAFSGENDKRTNTEIGARRGFS